MGNLRGKGATEAEAALAVEAWRARAFGETSQDYGMCIP